ncbi:MAG: hypothetical protein Q8Q62_17775 [Mesorhizobium sp.]|nr:hypothetical protein [Mesorhizobium sp.]
MKRCAMVGLLLCSMGPAAAAASLSLDGTWGDEAGCRISQGGGADTDTYVFVRNDEVRQHEASCEVLDVLKGKSGEQVLRTLCGGEGEIWLHDFILAPDLDPDRKDVLILHSGSGAEPLTVRPCG